MTNNIERTLIFVFIFNTIFLFSQDYSPKSSGEIITHNYYSLSYNEYHEQANWVHYKLRNALILGAAVRKDNFRADYNISSKSASTNDYKGSGYDRGHLAPAGDMKINSLAMSESFFMSNISPQNPSFNRGGWKKLESLVRMWGRNKVSYITTAGVLNSNNFNKIGYNQVSVPNQFYKIVYIPSDNKMIAFLMPNKKIESSLKSYVVSVDKVEKITGIDFHHKLEDELENKLESKSDVNNWDFKLVNYSRPSSSSLSSKCKGIAKSTGNRCRNKTTKSNGYYHVHQSQSSDYVKPKSSNYVGRCNAKTKKGSRCKRNASGGSRYCWQHG